MTDGAGNVAEFDASGLRRLRLREGGGGRGAALTGEHPPSLAEAIELARGSLLVNLDAKGDEVIGSAFDVVAAAGAEREILMKTAARHDDPVLVDAAFLGRTLFMPIIRECTPLTGAQPCSLSLAHSAATYAPFNPIAYEVSYGNGEFLREGAGAIGEMGSRIWVNTLEPRHAAGHTDALALTDPERHWGQVVRDGANIIQTDYPAQLLAYLRDRGLRQD